PETGVVAFISELEALARGQATSMKVLSVSTGSEAEQPMLLLSVAIEGTFDAVMRTIGAIEYAPYDLALSKISLAKSDGEGVWHADLALTVGSVPSAPVTATP